MKLIGIVGRAYYNKDNQKIIQLNEALRMALAPYEEVIPILLLPTNMKAYVDLNMGEDQITKEEKKKLDFILNKCDAFILPGGTYWYQFDEYVIEHAIHNNKPLLAICAGFQALCSMYAKNRDKFDMTKKLSNDTHYGAPNELLHSIYIKENTKLKETLNTNILKINSIHHDYIDCELNELIISAKSEDGIIEAVELPNHKFLIGIQWHPEYLMDDASKKLIDSFINHIDNKIER